MRDIKLRYWLLFLAWKLVALGVFIATGSLVLVGISLLTSIPWWLYVLGYIGGNE